MWFTEDDLVQPPRPLYTPQDVQLEHARRMDAVHRALVDVLRRPRARSRIQTFSDV
jgi:hypothetical protein